MTDGTPILCPENLMLPCTVVPSEVKICLFFFFTLLNIAFYMMINLSYMYKPNSKEIA